MPSPAEPPTPTFRFWERIMLQHAYPPKLALDSLGIAAGVYFLWTDHVVAALLCLVGLSVLGNVVAWNQDLPRLAATPLGRWMLGQARPVNLIVRTLGGIGLAYGVWRHSATFMLAGAGLIGLARWLGAKRRGRPAT